MPITKPRLSQSLLKDYVDYYDQNTNGCGLYIWKKHFEKIPTTQSDTQKLGVYFEYLCTGYLREGEQAPQPEMVYKGTPKEKMAADYERATQSAQLFKRMIEYHNIKILKVGEYLLHNNSSGILDIRAEWGGEECVIDIKYTSLFDDKFNPYGWHTESLIYKSSLLLQPIHYKYLIEKMEGKPNIPFYFFVFSAKDPEKAKIIKTNIQDEHIYIHEENYVEKMKRYIEFHYNNPDKLEARPNYVRCKDCSYFDICEKRAEIPLVETVDY
jgi:hypothetical protein